MEFFEDLEGIANATTTQAALVDTQERIGMILDLMPIGLLIHQRMGILFANQAAADFFETTQPALVGQHLFDFLTPEDRKKVEELFEAVFSSNEAKQISEISIRRKSFGKRFYRLTSARLPWQGTPVCQILVQDITPEMKKAEQLKNLLATDSLTGAQNRRSFIEYAGQVAQRMSGQPVGVIFIDIDHFKSINDRHGHDVGDHVLKKVVVRSEYIIAKQYMATNESLLTPMFARLGGEEFAVLVPGATESQTAQIAEELRGAIVNAPVETPSATIQVTISLGLVSCSDPDETLDQTLRKADQALYTAKRRGRNTVVAYSELSANDPLPELQIARVSDRNTG